MYFVCGVGSTESGYEILITTSDSRLYGATITISRSGSYIGTTTFDNQGEASYTVEETGTYLVAVSFEGNTYSETVTIAPYQVELTAEFVYTSWLTAGDVSGTYADLAAVLADEEAVRKLMTMHASVDYLASFTADDASVVTILNNDYAAKWITLRAYAEDTLTAAYSALMESIGKYGYGEWSLMPQVPKMTSSTAPYGEVFASSYTSGQEPYMAFDGNASTYWSAVNGNVPASIGYAFTTPKVIRRVGLQKRYYNGTLTDFSETCQIQGKNGDGAWENVGSPFTYFPFASAANPSFEYFDIENNTAYERYQLVVTAILTGSAYPTIGAELQFYAYAPKGNVPIMTSNSAPYGEASADNNYSSYYAYCAFDNDYSNAWISQNTSFPHYVGYKFVNPINVRKVLICPELGDSTPRVKSFKIQGSNDGSTWTDLFSGTYPNATVMAEFTIDNNDDYYLYHRIYVIDKYESGNNHCGIKLLQFYGRELSESVPKMTSNTAPYGEVTYSSQQSPSTPAYSIMGRNIGEYSDGWYTNYTETGYVCYRFLTPIKAFMFSLSWASYNYPTKYELLASNDGNDWDTIGTYTNSTPNSYAIHVVNSNDSYKYWKLNITESAAGSGASSRYLCVKTFNINGMGYSEKEWDTEHPRHYIYDHGVELEELEALTTANGWTPYSGYSFSENSKKEPNKLSIGPASSNKEDGFGNKSAIDFTDYNLVRFVADPTSYESVASITFNISSGKSLNTGRLANLSFKDNKEGSIDVSSINQTAYIEPHSDNSATRYGCIYELWLE